MIFRKKGTRKSASWAFDFLQVLKKKDFLC